MRVLGFIISPDDAVCAGCSNRYSPDTDASPIYSSSESDTPTHCRDCGDLIPHALTPDGLAYVAERLSAGDGDPGVLQQWRDEYGDALSQEV